MKIYEKQNPHLFDVPITEIEHSLQENCDWLDTIFGRCERLVKEINGKKYYSANWYLGGKEYVRIAPDEGLGNFAFFVLDEPTDLETYFRGDVTRCSIGFALIIWADMRKMTTDRDTEAIKDEIITILSKRTFLHNGRVSINRIYERAENVFREFDYDEIDNQFMMHPFAGFRFEGEFLIDTLCTPIS